MSTRWPNLWQMGQGARRCELVNGEVIEMAPVGGVHGQLAGRLYRKLAEHVERHGGGEVLVGDVDLWRSCRPRIPSPRSSKSAGLS